MESLFRMDGFWTSLHHTTLWIWLISSPSHVASIYPQSPPSTIILMMPYVIELLSFVFSLIRRYIAVGGYWLSSKSTIIFLYSKWERERERVSEICSQITRDPLMVNARACVLSLLWFNRISLGFISQIFLLLFSPGASTFSQWIYER